MAESKKRQSKKPAKGGKGGKQPIPKKDILNQKWWLKDENPDAEVVVDDEEQEELMEEYGAFLPGFLKKGHVPEREEGSAPAKRRKLDRDEAGDGDQEEEEGEEEEKKEDEEKED